MPEGKLRAGKFPRAASLTNVHTPQLPFYEGAHRNGPQMRRPQAHTARRRHQAILQIRILKAPRRQARLHVRATAQHLSREHPAGICHCLRRRAVAQNFEDFQPLPNGRLVIIPRFYHDRMLPHFERRVFFARKLVAAISRTGGDSRIHTLKGQAGQGAPNAITLVRNAITGD